MSAATAQQFADVPYRDMSAGQLAGQLFGFALRPAGQLVSACVLLADRLGPASDVLDLTYPLDAHAHAHRGHRDVECHCDGVVLAMQSAAMPSRWSAVSGESATISA